MKHVIDLTTLEVKDVPYTAQEILSRQAEEAAWLAKKDIPPDPDPIAVAIAALEAKVGITEQDKESAKQSLMTIDKGE